MTQLGCSETLDCFVTDRTSRDYLFAVPYTGITWERLLDDTSKAKVTVKGAAGAAGSECCGQLADAHCWANEVVIVRNGVRIWGGPITSMTFEDDGIDLEAEDISSWLSRRRIHATHSYIKEDLVAIFEAFVEDAVSVDNAFGLIVQSTSSGEVADRFVGSHEYKMADKELDELAKTGVDWTMVDRVMYVGGTEIAVPDLLPTLVDYHMTDASKITEVGEIDTEVVVLGAGEGTDGNAVVGSARQGNPTIVDTFGVHEAVITEDRIRDAQSAIGAAQTRLDLFGRPPTTFSGGTLTDEAPFDLAELLPGSIMPVALGDRCRPVFGNYRIQKVKGAHGEKKDDVTIELQPVGSEIGERS